MFTEKENKILCRGEDAILRRFEECLSAPEPLSNGDFATLLDGVRVLDRICRMRDRYGSQQEASLKKENSILSRAEDAILRRLEECMNSPNPISINDFGSLMDGIQMMDRIFRMMDQQGTHIACGQTGSKKRSEEIGVLTNYMNALLGEKAALKLSEAIQNQKTVLIRGAQGPTGKTTLCRILREHGIAAVEEKDVYEVILDTPLENRILHFDSATISQSRKEDAL